MRTAIILADDGITLGVIYYASLGRFGEQLGDQKARSKVNTPEEGMIRPGSVKAVSLLWLGEGERSLTSVQVIETCYSITC